jgi:hypothetical protein
MWVCRIDSVGSGHRSVVGSHEHSNEYYIKENVMR